MVCMLLVELNGLCQILSGLISDLSLRFALFARSGDLRDILATDITKYRS